MGAVERVGDDEAQHRVAEELQALVGGQTAVLVGVRAVGQGALEQRLVDRAPDHLEQVVDSAPTGRGTVLSSRPTSRAHLGDPVSPGARCARRGVVGPCTCRTTGTRRALLGLPALRAVVRARGRLPVARDANGCCCARSSASGRPRHVLFSVGSSGARSTQAAQGGPPGVDRVVVVSGSSASCAPHSEHRPGQSSRQSGCNGSAGTTASRSTGSRSIRSPSSRAVVLVVLRRRPPRGGAPPDRRKRTAPGGRVHREVTGSRHRTHSPVAVARTEPVTRIPSTTDSSRSSRSSGSPAGMAMTSVPRSREPPPPGERPAWCPAAGRARGCRGPSGSGR